MQNLDWVNISPAVNSEAEFMEIASDFGNPLEIVREGISNAVDAGANEIAVTFEVHEIEGAPTLVIEIADNGNGMTYDVLTNDFWGLGFSNSRDDKEKIGEKGHGTKIYLRSESVSVHTTSGEGSYEAICERPMRALTRRKLHEPRVRKLPSSSQNGTLIRILGYNQNERSSFVQDIVRDYIIWFTKFGSIERMFGVTKFEGLKLKLKCLDRDQHEVLSFGHYFPPENPDIDKLFAQYGATAADMFVKYYVFQDRLRELPEVTYDAIISVEGDQVKRGYNPMIRDRRRKDSGRYKVADRYGIWLCKDYIPIQNINDWISGFGTGSNSYTLLHGFINCQRLKLTANRGSIANTDPKVVEELKKAVQVMMDGINAELNKNGIYTLFQWQTEERTLAQEKQDFDARTKSIENRKTATLGDRTLLEPRNESELFGLFTIIYGLHPNLFDFEPLDYSTNRGIDLVARNKTGNKISESSLWYVELKYLLRLRLNHGFKYLRWIVCWDFDQNVKNDTDFTDVQETEIRRLEVSRARDGKTVYFLNSKTNAVKIQVIRLKTFLKEHLGVDFRDQVK